MKRHSDHARPTALRVRIRVGARLDGGWSSWCEGLAVRPLENGESCLRGLVPDQASLHGLLSRIRDLGVPLLGLEVTDAADGSVSDKAPAGRPEGRNGPAHHEPRPGARPT